MNFIHNSFPLNTALWLHSIQMSFPRFSHRRGLQFTEISEFFFSRSVEWFDAAEGKSFWQSIFWLQEKEGYKSVFLTRGLVLANQ